MTTTHASGAQDVAPFKQIQRFIWSQGSYAEMAAGHADTAARLADAVGAGPGTTVLDVAAGDGNVAVACAERGATVTASDITPKMVELGRARSQAAGLAIEWHEADAEALPFDDGSFDIVTSAFGAMFAPRPAVTAAEIARVTRAGGTIGLTAWTPDSFVTHLAATIVDHLPVPPNGLPEPGLWGVPEIAAERLAPHARNAHSRLFTTTMAHPSHGAAVKFFERVNGPLIAAQTMLRDEYPVLHAAVERLINDHNDATDGTVRIEAAYLLTTATRTR